MLRRFCLFFFFVMLAVAVSVTQGANSPVVASVPPTGAKPSDIPDLWAWWDATEPAGVVDGDGNPLAEFTRGKIDQVVDRNGGKRNLHRNDYDKAVKAFHSQMPQIDLQYGALGLLAESADPRSDARSMVGSKVDLGSGRPYTLWITWTRPRWRLADLKDAKGVHEQPSLTTPVLALGKISVITLPAAEAKHVTLFGDKLEVPVDITPRHTHSLILRNTPGMGVDVWLDDTQVLTASANPLAASVLDTIIVAPQGGLFFHDAGIWQRPITDAETATLRSYLARYNRGPRLALGQLSMGQSNQGMHVGVHYTNGIRTRIPAFLNGYVLTREFGSVNTTIFGGNGLYATKNGTFLKDVGGDPAKWEPGEAGKKCMAYIDSLSAQDKEYIQFVHWLDGESDMGRSLSELPTYKAACVHWMDLVRQALGRTPENLPWVVPAIQPYGYGKADGHDLVRRAWADLAAEPRNPHGVFIASRNNADTDVNYDNALAFGGSHMSKSDCRQMAVRDGLCIARLLRERGFTDGQAIAAPSVGPTIADAIRIDGRTIDILVKHDTGTDLIVPPHAAGGLGWIVVDGTEKVAVTGCQRMASARLRLTLAAPVTNAATISYCAGGTRLAGPDKQGHGNAITDNASLPATEWAADLPLPLGLSNYPVSIHDSQDHAVKNRQ